MDVDVDIINNTNETNETVDKIDKAETDINEVIDNYDTLVISGSSTKGIIVLGSLQYASDNMYLQKIRNYIGTSSGAIICYLLAIGYTPIEIIVYICTHHFLEKMIHLNVLNMINGVGATSFAHIQEELEKMTISKLGYLPTMKDIYTKMNKKLIVATHNLSKNITEYLSYDTYPDLPCITALRMTANLPLIFEKFTYNESLYIDGGLSDNFPIDLAEEHGNKILGIYVDTTNDTKNMNDVDIIEYIFFLFDVPVFQATQHKVNKASCKCKFVKLVYENLNFFDFNIDPRTKLEMFSSGYSQTKKILE
jgi:predicted acylesterase/phospholipase RssA